MNFKIIFRERAKKSLNSLAQKESKKILETIIKLGSNPYPHGYKKLKGRIRQSNYL